jgi:hypothetical protein
MAEYFNTQRYEFLNMNGLKWNSKKDIATNAEGYKTNKDISATTHGRVEVNTKINWLHWEISNMELYKSGELDNYCYENSPLSRIHTTEPQNTPPPPAKPPY